MYFNNKTFFSWTEGKNIDVIGFGVSNAELVFRLAAAGASVTLHDRRKAEPVSYTHLDVYKRQISESEITELTG